MNKILLLSKHLLKHGFTQHLYKFLELSIFNSVNQLSSDIFLYQDHPAKLIFADRIEISFIHICHKILLNKIYDTYNIWNVERSFIILYVNKNEWKYIKMNTMTDVLQHTSVYAF